MLSTRPTLPSFIYDYTLVLQAQRITTGFGLLYFEGFRHFYLCCSLHSTRDQGEGEPPHTSAIAQVSSFVNTHVLHCSKLAEAVIFKDDKCV